MLKKTVLEKIVEIESELCQNWKSSKDFSLMTGIGGLPLFYVMLFKLTNDNKHLEKINDIVEELFERLNNESYSMSYSSGISGLAYMFHFLNKNGFIQEDIEETLTFLDDVILDFTEKNLRSYTDTDFLHGALGNANYLLMRSEFNPQVVNQTIAIFEKIAGFVEQDIANATVVSDLISYEEEAHTTNCGLAHGHISSIIIFSKFLEIYSHNEVIKKALEKSTRWVLTFKSTDEETLAAFPSIAVNRALATYRIPLGWCYGDQTVSLGLFRASEILKNKDLYLESVSIAKRTLRRDDFVKAFMSPLSDAGFCHGASSLAYLHKKWFEITKEVQFKILYEKFMEDVIRKGNDSIGLAGYRKYKGNDEYENAIGLLDGIIGIGIVLIDYMLKDEETINWDEFFLLD